MQFTLKQITLNSWRLCTSSQATTIVRAILMIAATNRHLKKMLSKITYGITKAARPQPRSPRDLVRLRKKKRQNTSMKLNRLARAIPKWAFRRFMQNQLVAAIQDPEEQRWLKLLRQVCRVNPRCLSLPRNENNRILSHPNIRSSKDRALLSSNWSARVLA
jgi:hypothetical protein